MLWVGFAIAILVGVFLYWCRCRHRVLYGAAEILVALLLLYLFLFPEAQGVIGRNSWIGSLGPVWGFYMSRTVTLFGGLYALVRGLDNIDALEKWNRVRQGVRREGLWMRRWLNVFGLIFGMIGVVIIFLWGPPQPSFQQGVWVGLNPGTRLQDRGGKTVAEIDAETAATKTFYQHMSQLGLVFIFIGFGCQLIAVWPRLGSSRDNRRDSLRNQRENPRFPPAGARGMSFGSAAAAQVRLIVWCNACRHQVEPGPAEMAARYGADTSVLELARRYRSRYQKFE